MDFDGAHIHLVDEGAGPPVLFLHGNPDSADIWEGVIARLRGRYRCLAPDLPGFGRSTMPRRMDVSLPGMARFVDAVVRHAGVTEPISLVVHDVGGIYGLAWAVDHPAQIRRLAISNTAFFNDYRWHFWARVFRTPLLGELSVALFRWPMFKAELRRGSRRLSDDQLRRAYQFVTPAMKQALLRWYRARDPGELRGWEERLPALTARVPTWVLWGEHDPYIARRFAERFGAARVVRFPDSGHWPMAEEPESYAAQLLELLG